MPQQPATPGGFTPPPISYAFVGHLLTGAVKAGVIAFLLWGSGLVGGLSTVPVTQALVIASVTMLIAESLTTAVERAFVVRHRHPDPGSFSLTAIVAVIPVLASGAVGTVLATPEPGRLVTIVTTTLVYWTALLLLERPWVQGGSQADVRRRLDETTAMTRDHFSGGSHEG